MTKLFVTVKKILLFATTLCLGGCLGMPKSVTPINNFQLNRYLGKWYEIARLDHSFERGMEQVTAEYVLREDGGVAVTNRGFLTAENKWKEATGKAFFVEEPTTGYLKVSFFGPFYGSYVIFELDRENYQYAFVSGPDTSYLWLLSRTPTVDQKLLDRFVAQAKELGFATEELIYVPQK
ncbi:MAG: lipocalin [Candidatus Electrothrix sp. AW5]|jgi:apolipoprotein D and lipocalin family protein|nr:lipocalin [Candidatus Electrothrix gigas]MCI5195924.1 lipocalin [Candidatus Electrothrix gigas]